MQKRLSVIGLVLFMVFGLYTFCFGQAPDISGSWLVDLSGQLQGGALITITASSDPGCQGYEYQGYGLGIEGGGRDGLKLQFLGCLAVDEKGKITGDYTVNELEVGFPNLGTGSLAGKVDKKFTKLSLKFEDGPNGKGVKLPDDPQMPFSWTATVAHGKAVFALTIKQTTYDDDLGMDFPHRMYSIYGTGEAEEGTVSFEGGFFLNARNVAYGWYAVYDEVSVPVEEGFFFGKMKLTEEGSSFSFKLTGYDPDDGSMAKAVLKGIAE